MNDGRIFGREITPTPNFAVAKKWLEDCLDNHTHCNIGESEPPPKRLIQIEGCGKSQQLFLIETEVSSPYRYAALSYRWAASSAFVTTKENYHDRIKGFSLTELPLTLQHAVTTSYILGLQYLWIDSICIIQGTSDWETECPKMGSIYQGSVVTIAAEVATDSMAGFFQSRNADDPNVPLTCELQYTGSDGASTGPVKLAYPRLRHCYEYNASEMSSVLRLRGWVLQERILSPRMLHFGARQMSWSCNETDAVESLHYPLPGLKIRSVKMFQRTLSTRQLFMWWNELIEEYTTCNLTYRTDKLPALSGLAASIQPLTKSKYIAGMWEDDLPRSLIWGRSAAVVDSGAPPSKGPSWSWVSCDHPVQFFDTPYKENKYHSCLKIIHANAQVVGRDPFGQVSSGLMRLEGRLKPGLIGRFDFEPDRLFLSGLISNQYKALALFEPDDPDIRDRPLPYLNRSINEGEEPLQITCLLVGYRAYREDRYAWGLALELLPETKQYRRVGLLSGLRRILNRATDEPDADMKAFGLWFEGCETQSIEIT
jgi:Heterokaryon incompatibility protein (HET)